MKIIALEEEFLTENAMKISSQDISAFKYTVKRSEELIGADVGKELFDIGEGRISAMDEAGVDMQVLSFIAPQIKDAQKSIEMMREGNDKAAEAIKKYPGRFAAFASLPLADPKAAVDEFKKRISQPGFVGIFALGSVDGEFLDDKKFWPVLEAAEAHNAPIYLHPDFPLPSVMQTYFKGREELGGPEWGFLVDASCHFMRLLTSGVFDLFPKLKIILGHLGEGIPYNLDRINNRLLAYTKDKKFKKEPADYIRENLVVTTSGDFSFPPLLCAISAIGVDNILFSVDWPFESNKMAVDFLKHIPVSKPDLEKIAYKNAARVLNLKNI